MFSQSATARYASGTTYELVTRDQSVSVEKSFDKVKCEVLDREAVLFKLYARKTNHVYISLLSSQNVIFVNRSVKCDTEIYGHCEYLNAQDLYVFFKQGFLFLTHFLIFLDQQNTHQSHDLRSLIST